MMSDRHFAALAALLAANLAVWSIGVIDPIALALFRSAGL